MSPKTKQVCGAETEMREVLEMFVKAQTLTNQRNGGCKLTSGFVTKNRYSGTIIHFYFVQRYNLNEDIWCFMRAKLL